MVYSFGTPRKYHSLTDPALHSNFFFKYNSLIFIFFYFQEILQSGRRVLLNKSLSEKSVLHVEKSHRSIIRISVPVLHITYCISYSR